MLYASAGGGYGANLNLLFSDKHVFIYTCFLILFNGQDVFRCYTDSENTEEKIYGQQPDLCVMLKRHKLVVSIGGWLQLS